MKIIKLTFFLGTVVAATSLLSGKAKDPGASLNGYRFEFPCKGTMPENPKKGAGCQSALVKGDPFKTVEPMMYKNGKMDGDYFYIGGEPNNATYNIYKIDIASPKSHYFLNRQDKVGHRIFTIDFTKTIEVEGGSSITLSGNGQNGKLISNFAQHVVPDIAPAPKPYHGQFIQIDVVKVIEVN
jgi:hypothetical protein